MLGTQEHYEVLKMFKKEYSHYRLHKEPKELWKINVVYQDGTVNNLYKAFIKGFVFGKQLATQST